MDDPSQDPEDALRAPPVLVLETSAVKRIFSAGILYLLAGLLGFVLLTHPPRDLVWTLFLVGMLAGTLWLAVRTQASTRYWLELRSDGLYRSSGDLICGLDEIASVNRGAFAFKPSNGFMLRLNVKTPRCWQPGLWWSLGDRVGVGGVTSANQTKAMAEIISAMIASR